MTRHHTPYLSPSRLTCYDWCPRSYRERYVDKVVEPPTPEMLFGVAVHAGLEALFLGGDAERAFLQRWAQAQDELAAALRPFGGGLKVRGLDILQQVRGLGLRGQPEVAMSLIAAPVTLPMIGFMDLVEPDGSVVDFKTTAFGWTQAKADAQVWQPAIYLARQAQLLGYIPRFRYVVAPRIDGPLVVRAGDRTAAQIEDALWQAQLTLQAIDAGEFECRCGRPARHQKTPAQPRLAGVWRG